VYESVLQDKTLRFTLVCRALLAFILLAAAFWLYEPLRYPGAHGSSYQSWTWWGLATGAAGCFLVFLQFGNKFLCRLRLRRDKAEMLRQSWLLQNVINAIPAPIYYKDSAGIYLGCNEAFEKFIGLSRDQIIGQSVYGVSPKDLADVYFEADRELFLQGGRQTYETSVVYADGSRREVLFHKAVFPGPAGRLGGLVGTMVDITERKDAEAKARYLTHFDALTELPNHVLFSDRINLAIAHAHRLNQRFAVFCLDLDHFKKMTSTS
jgi:PAS domain S-box-containing protein